MDTIVDQIYSHYIGCCPFRVTGLSCSFKQKGFYPDRVPVDSLLRETLRNIHIQGYDESEVAIICIDSNGERVREEYMSILELLNSNHK